MGEHDQYTIKIKDFGKEIDLTEKEASLIIDKIENGKKFVDVVVREDSYAYIIPATSIEYIRVQ
jgi:hypothetical protein